MKTTLSKKSPQQIQDEIFQKMTVAERIRKMGEFSLFLKRLCKLRNERK